MARKIVVTSGKGGVGKTTLVANLGYALSKMKLKVCLIDVDFGLNNLDVVMGIENKIVYDIIDVLDGKCRPKQALVQSFFSPNLYTFPSYHTYTNVVVDVPKIKLIINELEEYFDYILIDSPAGIENGFQRAVGLADEAIVLTTPHISAIRDADKIISILSTCNMANINLVINRVRGDLILDGDMINIDTIKEFLNINLIGVIPEDDEVNNQMMVGGMLSNNTDVFMSLKLIAESLHNGSNEIFDCTKKYKGLLGGIKKSLRKIV